MSSSGISIYTTTGKHITNIEISYCLQQASLAFDIFERYVGFSTDQVDKGGVKGFVNFVLNVSAND